MAPRLSPRPSNQTRRARRLALVAVLTGFGCTINTTTGPASRSQTPASSAEREAKATATKPRPRPEPEARPEPAEKPTQAATEKKKKKKAKAKPEVAAAEKPPAKPVVEPPAKPLIEPPTPVVEPPAPQPEHSRIVVPVKVELAALVKQIDALVPTSDRKDWKRITEGNDSPRADLKYELWRDPIEVELDGHTFRITVPVRYAATVRAWVKNPLSSKQWISIAKNESWGTRADPQRLTAIFEATPNIDEDWHVKGGLRLVKLAHGEVPTGKICKRVVIDICVQKSSIADEVREGIDEKLGPMLKKALGKVDARIEKALALKKRATAVWGTLQKAQALPSTDDTAWLVVEPSAVGVDRPVEDGRSVRVDLSIEGRVSVQAGAKPKLTERPLPKLSKVEGKPGVHVVAELRVPTDVLSDELERELLKLRFKGKKQKELSITRARLRMRADAKHPHRVEVQVAFGEKGEDEVELRGDLVYDAAAQRLSIEDFDFTAGAESVLAGFDHDAIRKQVQAKAHWNLGSEAGRLKKAIAAALERSLGGEASARVALTQLDVQDFSLDAEALDAKVILGGTLAVDVGSR